MNSSNDLNGALARLYELLKDHHSELYISELGIYAYHTIDLGIQTQDRKMWLLVNDKMVYLEDYLKSLDLPEKEKMILKLKYNI